MERKHIRADFHIHTDHSDGLVNAVQVVRLAREAGLDTIALTDHDAVGGLEGAAQEAERLGVHLVPGVEMTAALAGREIHLLAYFPDFKALGETGPGSLRAFLAGVQDARRERLRAAVRALRTRGVFITESEVFAGGRAESFGRLHLARALVNAGYARTENEAFGKHLNAKAGAVPNLAVEPAAVTSLVHELGGKVVWAHPEPEDFRRYGEALAAHGVDGIETHNHRRGDTAGLLSQAARERGLLATGGSDWHGGPNERPLGAGAVGGEIAEPFLEALHRRAA